VEIICETNEPNMIHQLVQNGIGVAFRPAYQVKLRREQNPMPETNWAVRIVDHHFSTPTCISRKKQRNLTPAAQAFFSFAEAHCQESRSKVTDFLNQHYPIS
jgi:DNA-binding transcriptional LysR family regulator